MTTLSEEARQAKTNYQNEWRRKNPDKVKAYINSYWERRAAREAKEEEARIESLHKNTCLLCGKDLDGMREDAKFCSSACRQKYFRRPNSH